MAKITQFAAPGNATDLNPTMAASWSAKLSRFIDVEVGRLAGVAGLQPQFYNASKLDVSGTPTPISWPAFPNIVELRFGDDPKEMFRQGEMRDNQDEYLEWTTISQDNKITRVMFTCEGPEYWEHVATDKALLVQLYSSIVGKPVPQSDLFTAGGGGTYRKNNKHNQQHAIHLLQPNNTLQAEINIAAQATIIRKQPGADPITDANDLINCSGFGAAQRHSDPHIGDVVNSVARQGCSLTLEDPIGLYIEELPHPTNDLGITKPGGGVVGMEYWRRVRGDEKHILRAVFEAPAGQPVVGDLLIGGEKITAGGQIVKAGMRVKLTGVVGKTGVFHNHSFPCPGAGGDLFATALTADAATTRATRRI